MATVLIHDGVVREVLPTSDVPLEERYPAEFLAECQQANDDVREGWTWDGSAFAAPAVPAKVVPQTVTMVQARLALLAGQSPTNAGKTLLDDVDAAIKSSDNPAWGIAWEFGTEVERHGLFVTTIAPTIPGLSTDAALDALFIAAAQIQT